MSNNEKHLLFTALQQSLLNQSILLRLQVGKNESDFVDTAIDTSKQIVDKLSKWNDYYKQQEKISTAHV